MALAPRDNRKKVCLGTVHATFANLVDLKVDQVNPENLFWPEVRDMIKTVLKPSMFTKFESVSLSKLNYHNFLLSFWISLCLEIPAMKLAARNEILCLKCIKRKCSLVKKKVNSGLHRMSAQLDCQPNPPSGVFRKKTQENRSLAEPGNLSYLEVLSHEVFTTNLNLRSNFKSKMRKGLGALKSKMGQIQLLEERLHKLKTTSDQLTTASFRSERPIFNLECEAGEMPKFQEHGRRTPTNTRRLTQSNDNFYHSKGQSKNWANHSMLSSVVDGKLSAQGKFYNLVLHNGPNSLEDSIRGIHFYPVSRVSNLEEDDSDQMDKFQRILQTEQKHLTKMMAKLNLTPCGDCLRRVNRVGPKTAHFGQNTEKKFKASRTIAKKHLRRLRKRFSEYSDANQKSLFANAGLCIELEKKHLFSSLLKLEDKLIAESVSEVKAITEFGKVLVEFKGSNLVFPFSMKELLRLNRFRSKCLFRIHTTKGARLPFSFSASLNKMNSWDQLPENFSLPELPGTLLLFRNFYSKPVWQQWKQLGKLKPHSCELEFARFCLNSRNYSRIVEDRDTLRNEKQRRKSKVKMYKGVSSMAQVVPRRVQPGSVVFTCHHCSYRGPKKHFLECYQKNFFTRIDPAEELLKVFLNLKSNIHMFCEKVFCHECVSRLYPERHSKATDYKNWICPFCREKCYCTLCEHRDLYFKMHDLFLSLGGSFEDLKRQSPIQRLIRFFLDNSFYDMKFELEGVDYVKKLGEPGDDSDIHDWLLKSKSMFRFPSSNQPKKTPKKKRVLPKIFVSSMFNLGQFHKTENTLIVVGPNEFDISSKGESGRSHSLKAIISQLKQFFKKVGDRVLKENGHMLMLTTEEFKSAAVCPSGAAVAPGRINMNSFEWKKGFENYLKYFSPFRDSVRFRKFALSENRRELLRLVKNDEPVLFREPELKCPRKNLNKLMEVKNRIVDVFELIELVTKREKVKLELHKKELRQYLT